MMKAPDWVHDLADQVWTDFQAAREKRQEKLAKPREKGESRSVADAKAFSFCEGERLVPEGQGTQFVLTMEEHR